jgi:outer membrane cobalamin receptor
VRLLAGTEWYARTYGQEFPQAELLDKNSYTNHTLAAYLETELYASNRFITRVGTRVEYSDCLDRASIAPRLSTAYKLGSKSQLSLAYGWFFQDPDNQFLLLNSNLDFERADHFTLNYMMTGDKRMLRTEAYFKQYSNLVKYGMSEDHSYSFINNQGDGYAYGLDFFWRDRKTIKNGEYWISYSYIESMRDYLDYPYEAVHNYTSKHNLTLVYKHWFDRLRSQVGVNYSVASPRYYNNPNNESFNEEQTKAYKSLNMNWSFLLKQHIIIYASVSNLLGSEQQYGHKYASIPDEEGIYQSAPILPEARRWFLIGCFITLSKDKEINQLDKIN